MGVSGGDGAGLEFVTVAPRVFLSYRRADTVDVAKWFSKLLREDLGGTNVFRDEEDLIGGQDWQEVLVDTIKASDATLVLIGDGWVGAQAGGTRRIDEPTDPVRSEVRYALQDRRPGSPIPVLVDVTEPPTSLPDELRPLFTHHAVKVTREHLRRPVNVDYQQILVSVWEALRARQVRGVLVAGTGHAGARIDELVAQLRAEGVIDARTLSRFASGVVIASARRAKRGRRRWPQVIVVVEPGDEHDEASVALLDALYRHPAIKNVALVAAGAGVGVAVIGMLASGASATGTTVTTHATSQLAASLPHAGSGVTGSVSTSWSNTSGVAKVALAVGSAVVATTAGVGVAVASHNTRSSSIEFADTTIVSAANGPDVAVQPNVYPIGRPEDAFVRLGPATRAAAPDGRSGDFVRRRVSVEIPELANPIELGTVLLPTSMADDSGANSTGRTVQKIDELPQHIDLPLAGIPTSDVCFDPANPERPWAGRLFDDGAKSVTAQFYVVRKGGEVVGTQIAVAISGPATLKPLPKAPPVDVLESKCKFDPEATVGYYSENFVS